MDDKTKESHVWVVDIKVTPLIEDWIQAIWSCNKADYTEDGIFYEIKSLTLLEEQKMFAYLRTHCLMGTP